MTITPETTEVEWNTLLAVLECWEPPVSRTLVIAPHPDDETLGVGGFIARLVAQGAEVTVVAVTDGERAYSDYPFLGQIRREEQQNALARLGVPPTRIVHLGLPDSDVAAHEKELLGSLLPLVSGDTHIVAPWSGDYHPDHEACGRVAEAIGRMTRAQLTSYFFWTWHRGTPEVLNGLSLRRLPLEDGLLLAKAEALLHHRSQLQYPSGEPILPDGLLAPARRPYEVFLVS
jgi:LmbE family N-acetylglucosaminyl deacetylase